MSGEDGEDPARERIERIERILLGGPRVYTRADIVARSGIPPERTLQIWRALGFAVVDDDAVHFTDADLAALRAGERLIEAGLITPETETTMTRALGHHLAGLAEWQVATLLAWLATQPGAPLEDAGELAKQVEYLLPEMELLQSHVWRRHLAAQAGRALAAPGERPEDGELAVGFTDMVGYTRLTRSASGDRLVRTLDRFEALAGDTVADHGGRVVKTIGDEVLYVTEAPAAAAEIALTMTERAEADDTLPQLRTGLALGPVLGRYGDVFGPVVNVAARLTSLARPGTVLVDTELAGRLDGPTYRMRSLRPVAVRGYSRLRAVVLRRGA